jgi:hypothetical protein
MPGVLNYLDEHVDVVLGALRHSRDFLTQEGRVWETTLWVRSKADAKALLEKLMHSVSKMAKGSDKSCVVDLELVRLRPPRDGETSLLEDQWGVRVSLDPR